MSLPAVSSSLSVILNTWVRLVYTLLIVTLGKRRLNEKIKTPNIGAFAIRILPRFIYHVAFPGLTLLNVSYKMFLKTDEPWLFAIDKLLRENDVFVDVGAFHGSYTLKASLQVGEKGKVIAIEPFPNSCHVIKRKIDRCCIRNVVLLNAACSHYEGMARLYLADSLGEHTIKHKVSSRYKVVRVRSLDDILRDLGISKVNLIKIDVEGAELDVLEGAKKTLQNEANIKLIIELHKYGRSIRSFLKRLGFVYFHLSPRHILVLRIKDKHVGNHMSD